MHHSRCFRVYVIWHYGPYGHHMVQCTQNPTWSNMYRIYHDIIQPNMVCICTWSIIPLTKYRLYQYPWLHYSWHKSGGFPLTYLLDPWDDPALKRMIYIDVTDIYHYTITIILQIIIYHYKYYYNATNYHDLPVHILLQIITTYHYQEKNVLTQETGHQILIKSFFFGAQRLRFVFKF